MPVNLLLIAALAAIASGIALLVLLLLPATARRHTVAGALVVIERGYGQHAAQAESDRPGSAIRLPAWPGRLGRRLAPAAAAAKLQHRLDLAGNPPAWSIDRIFAAKGLGLLGLALIGALYGFRSPGLGVLLTTAGGGAGYFLPDLLLYNSILKRQAQISAKLPDALDMLTVCVEAGLGFDAALSQVARNTTGPLAAEFARSLQEMQIGMARSQALRAMTSRTTGADLRIFVSALIQANELGVPVASELREQSAQLRLRRRQHAEEMAQKVPVKILLPLICCLFPVLFVIIAGPGAIMIAASMFSR